MGLPQLLDGFNKIVAQGNPSFFGSSKGMAAILCIEDFLLILAGTPAILSTFKNLLSTLIVFIQLQVKSLQLLVDTILLQIDILTPLIEEYKAIKAQLVSEISQFGLGRALTCPPIVRIQKEMIAKSGGVSLLGKIFKGVRDMDAKILLLEFRVIKLKEQVAGIKAYIAELNATTVLFQMIIDAINAQFPGA